MRFNFKHRVGAAVDLAYSLCFFPIIIIGSMVFFQSGATLYTQTTLYALIIVGALAAGAVAGITIAGSGDAANASRIYLTVGMGALYATVSALNISLFFSMPDGIGAFILFPTTIAFVAGLIMLGSQT